MHQCFARARPADRSRGMIRTRSSVWMRRALGSETNSLPLVPPLLSELYRQSAMFAQVACCHSHANNNRNGRPGLFGWRRCVVFLVCGVPAQNEVAGRNIITHCARLLACQSDANVIAGGRRWSRVDLAGICSQKAGVELGQCLFGCLMRRSRTAQKRPPIGRPFLFE